MSNETVAQLPAGWHADPYGRYESRYFDGERWSLNVRDSTGGVSRETEAPAVSSPVVLEPPVPEPAPGPAAIAPAPVVETAPAPETFPSPEPAPLPEPALESAPEPAPQLDLEPALEPAAVVESVAGAGRSRAGLVTAIVVLLIAAGAVAFVLTH